MEAEERFFLALGRLSPYLQVAHLNPYTKSMRFPLLAAPLAISVLVISATFAVNSAAQFEGPARHDPPVRALDLALPTENEAILADDAAAYYMWLIRHFDRDRVRTHEGGMYGYVRNARRTPAGWSFSRFHEGVDIAPVRRDARGEPLDEIRTVDDGAVVYVNNNPSSSAYGRYVVVEHWWSNSPFYTLYAHLNRVSVREGQFVTRGDELGVMGYTGTGLNRERAHLHFEVGMMLNRNFEAWFSRNVRSANHHGRFNGLNLRGMDPMGFLMASFMDSELTGPQFVRQQPEDITVAVPGGPTPEMLQRYPWLCGTCQPTGHEGIPARAPSWEIGLTRSGVPVRIDPIYEHVSSPTLVRVSPEMRRLHLFSRIVENNRGSWALSGGGRNQLAIMFTTAEGGVPNW
ncbi:hypothetical protein BH23BAC4_BH23BAC4_00620 [soil metagenome]